MNKAHIVLVPKIKQPSKIIDFGSISLYNVLYKLMSNVLANKLKKILPHIIYTNQSVSYLRDLSLTIS
jgi:hypothetical protein